MIQKPEGGASQDMDTERRWATGERAREKERVPHLVDLEKNLNTNNCRAFTCDHVLCLNFAQTQTNYMFALLRADSNTVPKHAIQHDYCFSNE